MAGPYYESPIDGNPYDEQSAGARRRGGVMPQVGAAGQLVDTEDPTGWLAKSARAHAVGTVNDFTNGVDFLARGLVGDEEGRQSAATEYLSRQERARALGPDIQSFEDARAAGGGVGDYAQALAHTGVGLIPDMVAVASGVGVAGTVARGATRRAIQAGIANQIESRAVRQARVEVAKKVAGDAAEVAQRAAGAQPALVSGAIRGAEAQVEDVARNSAMAAAARIAGRTPRLADTVENVGKWAGRVGGTVAGVPTLNGEANAELAAADDTSTADMWKLAAGTTAASATQLLPLERFLGKFGGSKALGEVSERAKAGLLARTGKEAALQGTAEGSQEVLQQGLQNASHAWVTGNLDDLVGPKAFDEYLTSFLAGGILGGAMGGGGELGRAGGDLSVRGVRALRDKTSAAYRTLRDKVAVGAEARRQRAEARMAAEGSTPAEPGAAEGTGAKSAYASAVDRLRDVLGKVGGSDAAGKVQKGAVDLFNKAKSKLSFNDDIDAETDRLIDTVEKAYQDYERGEQPAYTELQDRVDPNHPYLQGMSKQARLMAGMLPAEIRDSEKMLELRPFIESAEKLFTDAGPSPEDKARIDALREYMPETVSRWEVIGPNFAKMTEATRKWEAAQPKSDPRRDVLQGAAADAEQLARFYRQQLAKAERDAGKGGLKSLDAQMRARDLAAKVAEATATARSAARELARFDEAADPGTEAQQKEAVTLARQDRARDRQAADLDPDAEARPDMGPEDSDVGRQADFGGMQEGGRDALGNSESPIDKLVNTPRNDPNYQTAQRDAQEWLLGGTLSTDPDNLVLGNPGGDATRITKENPTSDFWGKEVVGEDGKYNPGYVAIEGFKMNNGAPRKRAANLGSVMRFLQSKNHLKGEELLNDTLAQLTLAGLRPDLTSIRPGDIRELDKKTRKATGDVLVTITPRMAAALRAQAKHLARAADRGPAAPLAASGQNLDKRLPVGYQTLGAVPDIGDGARPSMRVRTNSDGTTRTTVDRAATPGPDAPSFDQIAGGAIDPREFAQGPRGAPPETKEGEGKTSSGGNVFDVTLSTPHAGRIKRALSAKPADRQRAIIDAGIQIGVAELTRRHDNGQMSNRKFHRALKAVQMRPDVALRYFERAQAGDFDGAPKVHETRTAASLVDRPEHAAEAARGKVTGALKDTAAAAEAAPNSALGKSYAKLLEQSQRDDGLGRWAKDVLKVLDQVTEGKKPSQEMLGKAIGWMRNQLSFVRPSKAARFLQRYPNQPRDVQEATAARFEAAQDKATVLDRWYADTKNALDALQLEVSDSLPADHPLREALEGTDKPLASQAGAIDMRRPESAAGPITREAAQAAVDSAAAKAAAAAVSPRERYKARSSANRAKKTKARTENAAARKDIEAARTAPEGKAPVTNPKHRVSARVRRDLRMKHNREAALERAGKEPSDPIIKDEVLPATGPGAGTLKTPQAAPVGAAGADTRANSAGQLEMDLAPAPNAPRRPAPRSLKDKLTFNDTLDSVASTEPGGHDYKKETDMLNSMLKAMGIKSKVTVLSGHGKKRGTENEYDVGTRSITIDPTLTGPERVEVLMHELGHHIVFDAIAQHVGWDAVAKLDTPQAALDLLAEKEPKLFKALAKDFAAYSAKLKFGTTTARDMLMARKPLFRSGRVATMDGKLAGQQTFTGATGFHEWIADHIARALTTQRKPVSLVDKFFADIASKIRKLWNSLSKEGREKYKPAKSVDAWVRQMFSAEAAAMKEVKGTASPRADVEGTTEAAAAVGLNDAPAAAAGTPTEPPSAPPPSTSPEQGPKEPFKIDGSNIEAFKAAVRTMLRPRERQILDRVLSSRRMTTVMRKALNTMFKDNPTARDTLLTQLDDAAEGSENRIAIGYMLFQKGLLNVGPKSTSALRGMTDNLMTYLRLAGDGEYAHLILSAIADGTVARRHAAGTPYNVREAAKRQGHVDAQNQSILDAARDVYDKAVEPLSKAFTSQLRRMYDAGIPAMRQIASMIHRPQGTTGEDNGLTPAIVDTTAKFLRQANEALGGLTVRERVKVLSRMQRQIPAGAGTGPVTDSSKRIDAAITAMDALFTQAYDYMKAAGVDVGQRKNFFPLVFDPNNTKAPDVLRKLLLTKEADGSYRYEAAMRKALGKSTDEALDPRPGDVAFPDADEAALAYFEKRRQKWVSEGASQKVLDTNQSILDTITHGSVKTIEKQIELSHAREDKRESVSKPLAEAFMLERRYMAARIKQLQDAGMGDVEPKTKRVKKPSQMTVDEMVEDMVTGALTDVEAKSNPNDPPKFRSGGFRLSQFIYDHGDAAFKTATAQLEAARDALKKAPSKDPKVLAEQMKAVADAEAALKASREDVNKLASIQSKDAGEILGRYFEPMVRHTEYTKRFGGGENGRAKLDALLARMREEGATDAQVEEAENAVAAAVGTYGADGSPVLRAISDSLAERFSGPKTKAVLQTAQAYQNLRLLPLSLLSSLVDPMGVAVRTGGDFPTAWKGFKTGLKTIFDKGTREDMERQLAQLGAVDDMTPALAAGGAGFGVRDAPAARKINDFVFKANGMQRWVTATRFMALKAGHGFLAKHKEGAAGTDAAADTSRRYLAELGLTPDDIHVGSDGQVVITGKTGPALQRFVNEAVLRPHSQQAPLWYSDPYMGVVTQYKSFLYAIYDQIGGRIGRELTHGNLKVVAPMLAYLPIVLASELLREWIQYGMGGNPRREEWGADDYLWLGAERSGLMGPKLSFSGDAVGDRERGNLPGTSFLGPTIGQGSALLDSARGRRDAAQELENALPFNPAYKHRVNPLSGEVAPLVPGA